MVHGSFVLGYDFDTADSFDELVSFIDEAELLMPLINILTPFPGTRLYRRLESEGRIIDRDWSHYDGQHVVYQPSNMSASELQHGTAKAWEICYSLKNVAKRLRSSAAPWYIAALTNWGYRHYAYRLDKYYTCDWFYDGGGILQE